MLRMYVSWVRTVRRTAILMTRSHRTACLPPTKRRKPIISESETVSKTVNEAEDVHGKHSTGGRKVLLVIEAEATATDQHRKVQAVKDGHMKESTKKRTGPGEPENDG